MLSTKENVYEGQRVGNAPFHLKIKAINSTGRGSISGGTMEQCLVEQRELDTARASYTRAGYEEERVVRGVSS